MRIPEKHATFPARFRFFLMRQYIQTQVADLLQKNYGLQKEIQVDIPKDFSADYSINTPLQCAKLIGKSPKELAEEVVTFFINDEHFSEVSVQGAGFVYFILKKSELLQLLHTDTSKWGSSSTLQGTKMMVEFAHPNTHKAFHI